MELYVIGIIVAILLMIVISNIAVVQQSRAYVIERLGAFERVDGVGIKVKWPFIERIARRVSLKEQVLDYPPQPVITKDNVTMQIDTVVYFQITDPKLYAYGVEQPMAAMETLTATTLRNIIGDLELDQTLTSRDVVNTKMRAILDVATDPWDELYTSSNKDFQVSHLLRVTIKLLCLGEPKFISEVLAPCPVSHLSHKMVFPLG